MLALALAAALVTLPERRPAGPDPAPFPGPALDPSQNSPAVSARAAAARSAAAELIPARPRWSPRGGTALVPPTDGAPAGSAASGLAAAADFAAAALALDLSALAPGDTLELTASVGPGTVGSLRLARPGEGAALQLRLEGAADGGASGAARGPAPGAGPAVLDVELLWVGAGPPRPRLAFVSLRVLPKVR